MISLSEEAEQMVREAVKKEYHDKVGGLSILFEKLIRERYGEKRKR